MTPHKIWADQPFQLLEPPCKRLALTDPFVYVASDMALAHNTMIRGLNTIYLQAPFVPRSDVVLVKDFLIYCQSWSALVEVHHSQEEDFLFPALESRMKAARGISETNIKQHEAFHSGLSEFERYCWDALQGDETFDAQRILAIIDRLSGPLLQHFKDEIPSLLALKRSGRGEELLKIYHEFEMRMRKSDHDASKVGPFTVLNTDKFTEGIEHPFPGIPGIGTFAIKHLLSRKYCGAWRFGCTDFNGRPVELWMHQAKETS
ncbi:hemerythrin HHE cation binding domain-containing protein [Phlyctema vagabunda]|uniref:Hemerythrin HHE cation binding domain-containing protein n=1 Tax=Phlyctema vagabunda TaxID=108571 RepID=A0ABR4PCL3_9HELO